ncbi:MAG: DNA repair protein RadC [candidate division WOR-3 bacterium]
MLFRDQEEIVSFLTAKKIYPIYRAGKVIFRKGKLPGKIKEEMIEKLNLKTKEDCLLWQRKIKEALKGKESHKPIKEWVKEERPRELLLKEGAEKIPLGKLLAIILRTGSEGVSAEELGRKLLNRFKSLRGIDNASIIELQKVEGIGLAKATQIKAAFELGKRLFREQASSSERIRDVSGAIKFVREYLGSYLRDAKKEYFYVIFLDSRNKIVDCLELSKGGRDASIVDKAEIVKEAVARQASSVILVHNHPSGEPDPSKDDLTVTKEITKALDLVGIKVLDHIIIGRNETDYFSFLSKGII